MPTAAEARVNEALKRLGAEYRDGSLSTDEYRARRRAVLASWSAEDAGALPADAGRGTGTARRARSESQKRLWLAGFVIGLLLVAMVGYFATGVRPPSQQAGAANPAGPPP